MGIYLHSATEFYLNFYLSKQLPYFVKVAQIKHTVQVFIRGG